MGGSGPTSGGNGGGSGATGGSSSGSSSNSFGFWLAVSLGLVSVVVFVVGLWRQRKQPVQRSSGVSQPHRQQQQQQQQGGGGGGRGSVVREDLDAADLSLDEDGVDALLDEEDNDDVSGEDDFDVQSLGLGASSSSSGSRGQVYYKRDNPSKVLPSATLDVTNVCVDSGNTLSPFFHAAHRIHLLVDVDGCHSLFSRGHRRD